MPIQIKPLKKYGQNFLINNKIAIKIINALDPTGDDI